MNWSNSADRNDVRPYRIEHFIVNQLTDNEAIGYYYSISEIRKEFERLIS